MGGGVDRDLLVVGREAEIAAVRSLVDEARPGDVVLFEGEAGIGKTTLLEVACARAERDGRPVLRAGAHQFDAPPFSLLAQLAVEPSEGQALLALADRYVHPTGAPHLSLFDIAPSVPAEAVDRLIDGWDRAGRLAGAAPLIALDDLQWADPTSLASLSVLVRRGPTIGVGFALALRSYPRSVVLDHFVDGLPRDAVETIRLRPLSGVEAATLLGLRLDGALGARERELAAGTGGNPFYVTELARALDQEAATGAAGGAGDAVPVELRELLLRRVRQLGAPLDEILRTAAILGRHVAIEDLAAITGRRVTDLVGPLSDAARAGLLEDDDGHLAFRHDLVAEALVEATPAAVRRGLHRDAAAIQSERGASPERVARHLLLGAEPGDRDLVLSLIDVARRAVAPVACDLLLAALDVVEPNDVLRDRIVASLVESLVRAGRSDEALDLSARALADVVDPVAAQSVRAARCHGLFVAGRAAEAVALWEANVEPASSPPARLVELAELALARLFSADPVLARRDADASLSLLTAAVASVRAAAPGAGGRRAGTSIELAPSEVGDVYVHASMAHGVLSFVEALAGRFDRAEQHGSQAVELARRDTVGQRFRYAPHLFHAAVLDAMARPEAASVLDDGRRYVEQHGLGMQLPLYHAVSAINLYRTGAWDLATSENLAGREVAAELSSSFANNWLAAIGALIAVHRGDLDRATAALEGVTGAETALGQDWLFLARAVLLDAAGDAAAGAELLAVVCAVVEATQVRSPFLYLAPDAVALHLRAGDEAGARRIAGHLGWVDDQSPPVARAVAACCTGQAEGEWRPVAQAAELLEAAGRPFDAARARHAAAVLAVTEDPSRSRALGRSALASYAELGAELPAGRLRAELRVAGVQLRLPAVGVAKAGWEALTPTELRIVELVGEGLGNAAIAEHLVVSRRTVESHLARIYDKVGVRSRGLLANEVARRSAVPAAPSA